MRRTEEPSSGQATSVTLSSPANSLRSFRSARPCLMRLRAPWGQPSQSRRRGPRSHDDRTACVRHSGPPVLVHPHPPAGLFLPTSGGSCHARRPKKASWRPGASLGRDPWRRPGTSVTGGSSRTPSSSPGPPWCAGAERSARRPIRGGSPLASPRASPPLSPGASALPRARGPGWYPHGHLWG